MGSLSEAAKSAILDLSVDDAQVERFTSSSPFGFGLQLRASRRGYEAFALALTGIRLNPELNRHRPIPGKGEPAEYVFDIYVNIPAGWQKP